MKCPKCSAENPSAAKFCNECDAPLTAVPGVDTSSDRSNLLQKYIPLELAEHIMSACQTGDGVIIPGAGKLSLHREFMSTVVKHVLAALWSIPNVSTKELVISFYKNLLMGKPYDAAIRNAQVEKCYHSKLLSLISEVVDCKQV